MQEQNARKNWFGQTVYVGIDVSSRNWQVCVMDQYRTLSTFVQDPRSEVLIAYMKREFAGARVQAVYEAGYHGYWICDALRAADMTTIVVNPADVPTMDTERVRKNDRHDALKLARGLRSGDLRALYVPSVDARSDRGLVRRQHRAVRDRARCKTRIRSLLAFHGIVEPPEDNPWTKAYRTWLRGVRMPAPSARMDLDSRLRELAAYDMEIRALMRQVEDLSRSAPYAQTIAVLRSVPGIGLTSAMTIATELGTITRFASEEESACYVGLIPGEHSSGGRVRHTGVIRRHNRFLRMVLVEASWQAIRKDPSLRAVYQRALKRGLPPAKAIVVIARKLWKRLDHCWRVNAFYEVQAVAPAVDRS